MKRYSNIRFGTVPFAYLLFTYLFGIFIGFQINPDSRIYLCIKIILVLCIAVFLLIASNRFSDFRSYKYLSILFYLFILFIGWSSSWRQHPAVTKVHFSNKPSQILIGYIADDPKITKTAAHFPFRVTYVVNGGGEYEAEGNIMVTVRLDSLSEPMLSNFQYGYELLIPSNFSLINPPFNPNEFDYQSYMANRYIWHQTNLYIDDIKFSPFKRGNYLIAQALMIRQEMIKKLSRSFTSADVLSITSALLLGYRNELDQEIINTFSATGTIHVLAVSGLHVGIIFLIFSTFLFWMKAGFWKMIKALILIVLIWTYAFITGLSPSVLRASIMISFGIITFAVGRRNNIYNTICASALFLLIYNPNFITEIGFQLSYLAVLGIVYLYPKLNTLFLIKNRLLSGLWSYATISVAAQLTTFPLVLYYFHVFPVYFLPANIFIILPVTSVLYLGVLVLLIPYGMIHSGLSYTLENLIILMNKTLLLFEQLPYAVLKGIWITSWQCLILYVFLVFSVVFIFISKKNAKFIIAVCLLLLLSFRVYTEIRGESISEIRVFNVYKTLAIGFFDKNGVILLTDSLTEENSRFQYSVKPDIEASGYLKRMKILKVSESFDGDNLLINNNIIQFGEKSLLIYSEERLFTDTICIDLLYIMNNSKIQLQQIRNNVHFKKIILDATNADWYINQIEKDARIMEIPIYILKNNFAYVW